jgi:HSP20 family protein
MNMLSGRAPRLLPEMPVFPEIERLMGTFLGGPEAGGFASFTPRAVANAFPPVNVWEDENAVHIESELPGFTMENLDISAHGDELTIAGSREETLPENVTVLRSERASYGSTSFKRTLRIGVPFDSDKVEATLRHGVLSILLPKAEAAKPRKIQIKQK